VLASLRTLDADDVARLIAFAVAQPPHVNLPQVVVMSIDER
jgi:NADP-dependent 3-hydroxy acid dehydrogenase YdfG